MHRFKDILYVASPGVGMTPALERAVTLALVNGGRLTVARVVDPGEEEWLRQVALEAPDLPGVLEAEREAELSELSARVAGMGLRARTVLLRGKPFLAVIREVLSCGHDLVMKEAESPLGGFRRRVFGSTDHHLMRKCPCPVWLFNGMGEEGYGKVLAAVDVAGAERDELNARIIQMASSLAVRERAALHVVHAWSLYGESILRSPNRGLRRERLQALLRATKLERGRRLRHLVDAEAVAGAEPVLHLVKASPALGIGHVARRVRADVVVMGTLSRAGVQGLLIGNTAEAVLSRLDCSVLTVKPAEFRSPVTLEASDPEPRVMAR